MEIKFRLRLGKKIVGYEKWYEGCFSEEEGQTANPCWLYSEDNKRWWTKYIFHFHKQKDLFTNLLDKNKKEIYEGDIVAATGMYNDVVEFRDGGFMLKGYELYETIAGAMEYYDNFEVIGNIYENPELLEAIK
jgi:hypothetical protein